MSKQRRPLQERLYQLTCEDGQVAPRRIPRKLKKEWRKSVEHHLREHRSDGTKRRIHMRWVPYQGWTLTIIHRLYKIQRKRIRRADLRGRQEDF